MSQINVEKTIDAKTDKLWSIIDDFGGVHRFHPQVETSDILNGQDSGIGAERECVFYDGTRVSEVVSDQRDGEYQAVTVIAGNLPLRNVKAVLSLSQTADGKTKVQATIDYQPKYGVFGKVMNALLIRPKFTKILGHVLETLEVHAKTGALIGKNGVVVAAPQALAS
jgi:ribosome-associated toxin RatA of RatAB toxin-antitoxin module